YRIFLSNLSITNNGIFFSKNDMYLFGFSDRTLIKLFLFQKLFLNTFIYRLIYVVSVVGSLIYVKEFFILSLIILLELIFFNLEYGLFRINHLISEQSLNLKIIGEVSVLSLAGLGIIIFKNISGFLQQHLIESFLILLLGYAVYIKIMIILFRRIKRTGNRLIASLLYRKIDVFTYKELKLFGQYIISNIFILITSVAFFLLDKNEFTPYALLLVITTSMLFIHKKRGTVTNFKNDNFFLNRNLFLESDNLLIIKRKFMSYLKISLLLKLPLLFIVNYLIGNIQISGILNLLILTLLLIIDEFNYFFVKGRINFFLHYTMRYMLSILVLIYTYSSKDLRAFFLVAVFLLKELYSIRFNFLKQTN
ncbi:TPA: hypothetical protein ACGOZ3_001797, partial [Streptococcus suis]